MSQPVLLKVYGNLAPANETLAIQLNALGGQCHPEGEFASLSGDLLTITFEGIYMPVEDVVAIMAATLRPGTCGKLDVLDLEDWRLTRYVFADARVHHSSAPLNTVLDYSMAKSDMGA